MCPVFYRNIYEDVTFFIYFHEGFSHFVHLIQNSPTLSVRLNVCDCYVSGVSAEKCFGKNKVINLNLEAGEAFSIFIPSM